MDVLIHIVVPELVERRLPRLANYLRRTSPRWGRSWRSWTPAAPRSDIEAREVN
jgi:hypothetical protein